MLLDMLETGIPKVCSSFEHCQVSWKPSRTNRPQGRFVSVLASQRREAQSAPGGTTTPSCHYRSHDLFSKGRFVRSSVLAQISVRVHGGGRSSLFEKSKRHTLYEFGSISNKASTLVDGNSRSEFAARTHVPPLLFGSTLFKTIQNECIR